MEARRRQTSFLNDVLNCCSLARNTLDEKLRANPRGLPQLVFAALSMMYFISSRTIVLLPENVHVLPKLPQGFSRNCSLINAGEGSFFGQNT